MKIKVLLLSAAVAVSCLFSSAYAAVGGSAALFDVQESANAQDGRIITVKIRTAPKNESYDTIYVLKSAKACDDGIITADEAAEAVYYGESANKGTSFDFQFRINAGESGIYTIVAGGNTPSGNLKSRNMKFWYNKNGLKDEKLSALNLSVTAENLEAGNNDEWYIDILNKAYVNNKDAVVSIVSALKPSGGYRNQFELEEAFCFACDVINSNEVDAEKFAVYAQNRNDKIGLDFSNTDYIQYSDEVLERWKTVLDEKTGENEIKNIDGVRNTFREACAIVCIDKTTDHAEAIGNLKRYNDIFKLDFNTKFPYLDEYEVAKAFTDTNYTTVSAIVKDYNNRVNELYNEYEKTHGGSESGRGGSKGGGNGSVFSPNVVTSDDVNKFTGNNGGFSDVSSSHWAYDCIQFVKDNKIMQGDENGLFRPDENITREEWVKTVLTAFVIDTNGAESEFSDVDTERWSYPYISKAFEMMIINGVSDTEFAPRQNISRQDASVMFYRGAKAARENSLTDIAISNFTDADDIADYALEPINILYRLEIIKGYEDGSFKPNAPITRAEAAKIIYTALEKLG